MTLSMSFNAELVTEALSVVVDAVPDLDAQDLEYVCRVHPWATGDLLSGLLAMSRGEPSGDTELITRLLQQLQEQQLQIGMLEAERVNRTSVETELLASSRVPSSRGQHQQSAPHLPPQQWQQAQQKSLPPQVENPQLFDEKSY